MDLIIGQATDVGIKRQGNPNQDHIGVVLPETKQNTTLLIVADGMGGHRGGEQASLIVVNKLRDHFLQSQSKKGCEDILREGIFLAHNQMAEIAAQDDSLIKMGSTVAAVIIENNQLTLANVGDSRAYIINENNIRQISWDHSFVYDLVRKNLITAEEAQTHPKRNVLTMSISAQRQDTEIYITQITLDARDVVLLCSDGLWGPVTEAQIQAVGWELPPQQAVLKLIELANRNQGPDNISVIIARHQLAQVTTKRHNEVLLEDTQP